MARAPGVHPAAVRSGSGARHRDSRSAQSCCSFSAQTAQSAFTQRSCKRRDRETALPHPSAQCRPPRPSARTAASAAACWPTSTDGRLVAVRGDRHHPPTAAARAASRSGCRSPSTRPTARRSPLWRADRDARFEPTRLGGRARHARREAARDRRRARPRRRRVLHLRPAADRGLLRDQQARQGLSRHEQRRLQLAPVHVLGGRRLHRRVRLRRPAARLRRHRARRLLPAARHEHGRLPPDPVVAHPRPPGRGRVRHLRRPAPRRRRRKGSDLHLPVRPGTDLALLSAMLHVVDRDGLLDDDFIARHTSGWEEARAVAREWPPARAAGGLRRRGRAHRAGGAPLRRRRRGDGAVVDGRQPVDGRHAEEPRADQPLPGDRPDRPARLGPAVADRPAQRDGRARDRRPRAPAARLPQGRRRRATAPRWPQHWGVAVEHDARRRPGCPPSSCSTRSRPARSRPSGSWPRTRSSRCPTASARGPRSSAPSSSSCRIRTTRPRPRRSRTPCCRPPRGRRRRAR